MADPFDVYSDSVGISTSDWGSNLYVQVQAIPETVGAAPSPIPVHLGTVRMSNAHLKVLAYLLKRQIKLHEAQAGFEFRIPDRVLESLRISDDEWQTFWA